MQELLLLTYMETIFLASILHHLKKNYCRPWIYSLEFQFDWYCPLKYILWTDYLLIPLNKDLKSLKVF